MTLDKKSMSSPILVIESDQKFLNEISERLKEGRYQIFQAPKITEALFKLRNQKFGGILLNVDLAQAEGAAVVDFIRKNPKDLNFSTPIIAMGTNLDQSLILTLKARVKSILLKPFDPSILLQKFEEALQR